jgi:hypothetical protein
MNSLLPKLIVAGLGASVSPVAVILLLTVMMRDRARRNSLLFLAGFTLTLLVAGIAIASLMNAAGSGGTSKLDAYIDIVLGVACLAVVPLAIRRKPKPPKDESEDADLKAFAAFTRGVVAMLINTSTWVIYIAGLHLITAANLGHISEEVLAILILTLVTLLTLIIPIAAYFIFPRKAQKVLGSARVWLVAHSKIIGLAILVIFGAYLLIKGITGVV